jgi:hypothetical protein
VSLFIREHTKELSTPWLNHWLDVWWEYDWPEEETLGALLMVLMLGA